MNTSRARAARFTSKSPPGPVWVGQGREQNSGSRLLVAGFPVNISPLTPESNGSVVYYLVAAGAGGARRDGHGPPGDDDQPVDAEGYQGEDEEEEDDDDGDGVVFLHFEDFWMCGFLGCVYIGRDGLGLGGMGLERSKGN